MSRRFKLQTLKSPLQVLKTPLESKLKPLRAPRKTLKQRQAETGRTHALNGAVWRAIRKRVLCEQPICDHCQMEPAIEVDHVDNDPSNNERSNLVGLCRSCHSRKTQADMGHRVKYGCDANGMPADPRHPWHSGR